MATISMIWNNLPGTTISLTDSEGKGANVSGVSFGNGGNLSSMPVPWFDSKDISAHMVTITYEGTNNTVMSGNSTIYLWQNGDAGFVYWSHSKPASGTDGIQLFGYTNSWILTVGIGFSLTATQLNEQGTVTNLICVSNQTNTSLDLTNSQGNGTNVISLGPGLTGNTGNMPVPWYNGGTAVYIEVTAMLPLYIWQNGSFIYWDTAQPNVNTCQSANVIGVEGSDYYLNIGSNGLPSLQVANTSAFTYVLNLVNAYAAGVTLSLTDSEGKGQNVSALAYGDDVGTNNMPVPWYYSPVNTNFLNHNITVATVAQQQTQNIYLWQNGDFVYWSYTQPASGTYTGNILCPSGGAFTLFINSSFFPVAVAVDTAAVQSWASAFLNQNVQFISQFADSIVAFAEETVTQTVIGDIKTFLGILEQPSLDNLYTQLSGTDNSQYFGSVAALAPSSLTALFPNPFTMMIGVSGAASFFAGGEAFAGAAFTLPIPPTTSSLGAGVLSGGVLVGTGSGVGVGLTIAICAGAITDQSGPSITVTFGVEAIAGVTVSISLGVPADPNTTGFTVTGISITVDAGAGENCLGISYDYTVLTGTFPWNAPSVQVKAASA